MRVLHAIWSLEIGGAETMLVDIVNRQARRASIALLVGNAVVDGGLLPTIASDVRVITVNRPPGSRNPWWLYRIRHEALRFSPDVFHSHSPSLVAAMSMARARKVLTVHDTGVDLGHWAPAYDLVISISHAVQANLAGRRPPVPSLVVHNGIDFGAISVRQHAGGQRPFRLVQVSRLLAAKKGQDLLLHALRALKAARGVGAVTADFIGDGPDRGMLESLASQLGVRDQCRFLGALSRREVYAALPGYNLLVQPSRYEGFGLTVVEGVAAGLPVLCADLEGPREILDCMASGYRFRPGDAEDCARQVMAVMDDSYAPGFGARLDVDRAALRNRFNIDAVADGYLEHYQRLLEA